MGKFRDPALVAARQALVSTEPMAQRARIENAQLQELVHEMMDENRSLLMEQAELLQEHAKVLEENEKLKHENEHLVKENVGLKAEVNRARLSIRKGRLPPREEIEPKNQGRVVDLDDDDEIKATPAAPSPVEKFETTRKQLLVKYEKKKAKTSK